MTRLLPYAIVSGLMFVAVAQSNAEPKAFDVWVAGGKLQSEPTLRVEQDDSVTITYHSDTALELHLHGYDITADVKPEIATSIQLKTTSGGRFSIEAHGHHTGGHNTLLYLEVHPR